MLEIEKVPLFVLFSKIRLGGGGGYFSGHQALLEKSLKCKCYLNVLVEIYSLFFKREIISIGTGKTIVEFFSDEIEFRVCKNYKIEI